MADNGLQQQIDYHAARAIEELERAERTMLEAERRSHMELSRLHLNQAGRLRSNQPVLRFGGMAQSNVLDMGEASREQGFRQYGCR